MTQQQNPTTTPDPVKAYEVLLKLDRSDVTIYELEHPNYDSEEHFKGILGVWEREREGWSRMWKEACPRPKRRAGRPQVKQPTRRKYAMIAHVGLTDELVRGLFAVKGDMAVDDCIRELLTNVLGPLAKKVGS